MLQSCHVKQITHQMMKWIAGLWLIAGSSCLSADAALPHFKMNSTGEVFATWLGDSTSSYPFVQFAQRSLLGTWSTPENLSSEISSSITCSNPTLYLTDAGIVVLWQYSITSTSGVQYFLASAILPPLSSTWNVSTISSSGEDAIYNDQRLEADASGNLVVMWTSFYPYGTTSSVVRVALYDSLTATWSSPDTLDD